MEKKPNKIEYDSQEIQMQNQPVLRDFIGGIVTSSIVPTGYPRRLIDQIVLYRSGATNRLFISDLTNNTWFFVNLSQL